MYYNKQEVEIRWGAAKNEKLLRQRGVCFETIIQARFLAVKRHPRRTHQDLLLFEYRGYVWVVPYVTNGGTMFLKTLFPSRKYTALWKKGALP